MTLGTLFKCLPVTHLTGRECKLEFAYRAQRFQVSAQAARFKKKKAHGVKMAAMFRGRPCLCEVFLTVL